MTEPNEPKKETTRIPVAPEVAEKPPEPNAKSRDTVRIQLPVREAPVHILTEPQPAVQEGGSAAILPAATTSTGAVKRRGHARTRSAVVGADKGDSSHPSSHGSDEKDSTACRHARGGTPQSASIAVAAEERNPMPLLWLLLGVSALILIIQIWTYLS